MGEGLEESLVIVLQETVSVPDSARTDEPKEEGSLSSTGMVSPAPLVRPYQPPVPYPQRVAWVKLFQLKPKFARFLKVLKWIYANTPFLEALLRAPFCIQFLRELLYTKGKNEGVSVVPIGEVCNSILQNQSPSKLQDLCSFFIPCAMGKLHIEGALCD